MLKEKFLELSPYISCFLFISSLIFSIIGVNLYILILFILLNVVYLILDYYKTVYIE